MREQRLEVHEFDYKAVNQEIYKVNGVSIRTIPAIHALDEPVSFILEWNGLKFALIVLQYVGLQPKTLHNWPIPLDTP